MHGCKVYYQIHSMTFSFNELNEQGKREEDAKACTLEKQNHKLWENCMASIVRNTF